jgi:hypothetical protein
MRRANDPDATADISPNEKDASNQAASSSAEGTMGRPPPEEVTSMRDLVSQFHAAAAGEPLVTERLDTPSAGPPTSRSSAVTFRETPAHRVPKTIFQPFTVRARPANCDSVHQR